MPKTEAEQAPEWIDTNLYPFAHHYFDLPDGTMHYLDTGTGIPVLFVHGNPAWSFYFRNIIKTLSKKYRCIAMDHVGYGLSDKPFPYPYSLSHHAENFKIFCDAVCPGKCNLIMHDFGGPIGIQYAEQNPGKVERLIFMNTWCRDMRQDPGFIPMQRILQNPLLPFLYRYLNFPVRRMLPGAFAEPSRLSGEVRMHYIKPFSRIRDRMAPVAFSRSLIHEQEWCGMLEKNLYLLKDKPALFLWGMQDAFTGAKYLDDLSAHFMHAEIHRYADAGHLVLEEKSYSMLPVIEAFLAS